MRIVYGVALAVLISAPALAGMWSEPGYVLHRGDMAVTYRARLAGDYLIVEAKHAPGWHSYSMDNKLRAREATGKESPECELPTRIALSGGLQTDGAWRQSKPEDLSQPDIYWYTWGFENAAYFAVPVKRADGASAEIVINAQACNASSCQMVQNLKLTVPLDSDPPAMDDETRALLEKLIAVKQEKTPAT